LTSVEQVKVVYADRVEVTPDLSDRDMTASVKYINACVGIQQTGQELANLVEKMSLKATLSKDGTELLVKVPPTRADVLHQCDIMEDAAIAYNINKIVETFPKANCVSVPLPINKLSDMIRKECAFAGFTEALAFTLCSHDENFKFLNKKENHEAVVLANPKTVEYQVVRTSLLPGILKTVSSNKHLALPLRLFECSDIVLRDESVERRARNQRNLCILYTGKTSGFEEIHGMVDRMMLLLGVDQKTYSIRESECETFFKGRRADLVVDGKVVGTFGVLHPDVLEHFEIGSVCSALELNLEVFL
jgi:phenylalanyl-tRNA synthetase beta chain